MHPRACVCDDCLRVRFDSGLLLKRVYAGGHPSACDCKECTWAGVQADVNRHQQRAAWERMIEDTLEAERALPQGTPAEEALFARLAERLMAAMTRAGLREAQKEVVVQEVVAAARELAADVEAGVAKQKAWRLDEVAYGPDDEDEQDEDEDDEDDEELVSVEVRCACCQRDLGPYGLLVTEDEAAYIRGKTRCPGCIREGRELP